MPNMLWAIVPFARLGLYVLPGSPPTLCVPKASRYTLGMLMPFIRAIYNSHGVRIRSY